MKLSIRYRTQRPYKLFETVLWIYSGLLCLELYIWSVVFLRHRYTCRVNVLLNCFLKRQSASVKEKGLYFQGRSHIAFVKKHRFWCLCWDTRKTQAWHGTWRKERLTAAILEPRISAVFLIQHFISQKFRSLKMFLHVELEAVHPVFCAALGLKQKTRNFIIY